MVPYSKEMRREVLAACDRGEGTRAVALRFRCSESWVRRVKQERRELGKTAPLLTRRRTPLWEPYRPGLYVAAISRRPDLTLLEDSKTNCKLRCRGRRCARRWRS